MLIMIGASGFMPSNISLKSEEPVLPMRIDCGYERVFLSFQSKLSVLKFFNLTDFLIMMLFWIEWLYAFKYFTEED